MAFLSKLSNYKDLGLLLIRIGLGVMFITHGYPKLAGGEAMWEKVGSATSHVGITFLPAFWGFLAAVSETLGGLLLLIGFLFRPACIFLLGTLLVATAMHLGSGDGLQGASHAIELAIVFAGLLFIGPGKYSVDKR